MDLTAGQRKAVFGLIVVVLAGLGAYMFVPGARGGGGARPRRHRSRSLSGAAATWHPPSGGCPVPGVRAGPAAPDIYQWLPFTQAAAGHAPPPWSPQFCDAYGTWSYSQNATSLRRPPCAT